MMNKRLGKYEFIFSVLLIAVLSGSIYAQPAIMPWAAEPRGRYACQKTW